MKQTILKDKAFDIALFVINTHEAHVIKGLDYKLAQKFLHFGTNIKVWIDDADKIPYAEIVEDDKEFLNSLSTARKYAIETKKVIISLYETEYLDKRLNKKLMLQVNSIIKLLTEIIDKRRYE